MTPARASDHTDSGAVYETEAAAVTVRPQRVDGDRSVLEYAVETDHPAPVRVRVRQPIPDSVAIGDLGFPGECAGDWERDGDALLFEREITPGDTVRTAWGVDGELSKDLEPPVVEAEPVSIELDEAFEVDEAALDGAETPEGSTNDQAGAEDGVLDLDLDGEATEFGGEDGAAPAAAGESEADDVSSVLESPPELDDLETTPPDADEFAIPAIDDGEADVGDELDDTQTPDELGSGGDEADADAEETDVDATTEESVTDDGDDGTDSVVHQLVAELHGEALDDGHRVALADALEVRLSDSTNAFVEHVRERQRRRADRIEDELEALEDSVDGLYGLKADASEVATLKRAITRLDDAKAGDGDLRELRSWVEDLAEASVDQADVDALGADHESLAASLEATDEGLAELAAETETEREAIREDVETVAEDLEELDERAATGERLDTVADDLATLRDAAATEAALDDLETAVDDLEEGVATESDLAELRSELESVEARLEERVGLLEDRHDELAAESATDAALESLRTDHRGRINEQTSELQALRERLEAEYSTDDELGAALDRRVHRSLAHLVAFGVGTAGLVSTVALAIAGSPAAAVTFLGGAGTLGLWWRSVGPSGLGGEAGPSLRDRLR